jgi:PAS domain S-box-containing protein
MIQRLRSVLAAPIFADEESTRLVRLVHIIGLVLGLSGLIPLIREAWAGHRSVALVLAGTESCVLLVLWLNHRGWQKVAFPLLILDLIGTATYFLCTSGEGFRNVALLVYPSTLVVAALLLRRRAFILLTVTCILCVGGVVLAEVYGWRVTLFSARTSIGDLVNVVVLLAMTAALAGLLSEHLRDSLTRARRNEAALRESEERLQQLANATFEGIGIAEQGRIIEVNEQLADMHGYRPEELVGRPVTDCVAPQSCEDVAERIREGRTEPYEHLALRKDGTTFPVEARGRVMTFRGRQVRVTAVRDITQRHRSEEQLRESREQLRALLARLQSSREEERTHIAREIHDHLGQLLTALKLDLRGLERRIAGVADVEVQTALTGKLLSARQLADETIESVQKIASELRPGLLDRLGLAAAMEAETQAFQARTAIRCDWSPPQEAVALSQELATTSFRIFQEILTNIARHAQATRVAVRLARSRDLLVIEATDNGIGIQPRDVQNPKSLGLLGMQERASMLGGVVTFDRNPGGGTRVTVRLPLNGKAGLSR